MILARAGLERLGYAEQLRAGFIETPEAGRFAAAVLGPAVMLPAVGQGAIGLQARADDAATLRILAAVNDSATWAAVAAERELLRLLGGGCQLPLGVTVTRDEFHVERSLRAVLFSTEPVEPPRFAEAMWNGRAPQEVAAECARILGFVGRTAVSHTLFSNKKAAPRSGMRLYKIYFAARADLRLLEDLLDVADLALDLALERIVLALFLQVRIIRRVADFFFRLAGEVVDLALDFVFGAFFHRSGYLRVYYEEDIAPHRPGGRV